MTDSFRPQARPVDTYVTPSRVAPVDQSGGAFGQFTRSLVALNPAINQYIDMKLDDVIEDEQAKGRREAEEERREKEAEKGFKKVVSNIRKKDGDELANQLIGGSIFSDRAYQRQKTRIAAENTQKDLFGLYQGKTFDITKNAGTKDERVIKKPITHFDASSPQFASLINEFSQVGANTLKGIDPRYHDIYYEAQSQAIEAITKHLKSLEK